MEIEIENIFITKEFNNKRYDIEGLKQNNNYSLSYTITTLNTNHTLFECLNGIKCNNLEGFKEAVKKEIEPLYKYNNEVNTKPLAYLLKIAKDQIFMEV